MKKIWLYVMAGLVFICLAFASAWFWFSGKTELSLLSPLGEVATSKPKEKPLARFSFENIKKREFVGSQINLEKVLQEDEKVISYLFSYLSDGKKVTGLANIPKTTSGEKLPVVVMLRGYVDQEIYETGMGTQRAGEVLSRNGFLTLAPDFLGYGESDMPENDVWWERFNNPVHVLNLMASLKSLPQAETDKIGIWAHSNGGQIAFSVLEITGQPLPTTLWAPVSKPFPYAILYFTDEFEDEGETLRAELARLEQDYDVRQYSITDYLGWIDKKTPMQIHQGEVDEAVPKKWSDELVKRLKELEMVELDYFVYAGADHNMAGSWDTVVARDLQFFNKHL